MPSLKIHLYIDRLNFGKVYYKMHNEMDWPAKILKKGHRVYFHDMTSVLLIARKHYRGDPNAITSGLLHLQIDEACTNDPVYRAQLDWLADQDIKERKRKKRREPKSKPQTAQKDLLKLRKDVKKLAKIQALIEEFRAL